MTKPRIIISVTGGSISLITADQPIDVFVFDWDNIKAGGHEAARQGIEGFRENLHLGHETPEGFEAEAKDSLAEASKIDDEHRQYMAEMEQEMRDR